MNRRLHINEQLFIDLLFQTNKSAFSFLQDTFSPSLHGSIIDFVEVDKEMTADVLEKAFSMVGRMFDAYDKRKRKLLTWLLHMVRRLTVTALQQFSAWPQAEELERLSMGLRQILPTLSRGQRCVIELVYDQGYSKARVAKTLNIPIRTVDELLQSGLQRLQDYTNSFF